MPNIGPLEIAIVAIVALIVFGPKRLPELGKSLGSGLREFKSSITGEDKDDDPPEIENGVEEPPATSERVVSDPVPDEEPSAEPATGPDSRAADRTAS